MQFTVTSGTGPAEIVDHLDSAKSVLDRALTLIGRRRKNVRVYDEDAQSHGCAAAGGSGNAEAETLIDAH